MSLMPFTPSLQHSGATPSGVQYAARRCSQCRKPLQHVDDNLFKDSLRMLCENHAGTWSERTSRVVSRGVSGRAYFKPADMFQPSKMPKLERNRTLHDCYSRHTNARKREYKRWDIPSSQHPTRIKLIHPNQSSLTTMGWADENGDGADGSSHTPSFELYPSQELSSIQDAQTTDRTTVDDEMLPEKDRLQLNINKIRQQSSAAMLREIQVIKDRHKTLAELTTARHKARLDTKPTSDKLHDKIDTKQALHRLMIHQSMLERDAKFNSLIEKTSVKLNRNFRPVGIEENKVGFKYTCPQIPGITQHNKKAGLTHRLHPAADAIQSTKPKPYVPIKPGDNLPAVFYPPACDAKTPVESAFRLHRFVQHLEQDGSLQLPPPNMA